MHHKNSLNKFYDSIIVSLQSASDSALRPKKPKSNQYKQVPGWNSHVKDSHCAARDAFFLWRQHGSPRNGPIATLMRRSRAVFKYTLRACKRNENKHRADSMAQSLFVNGNAFNFWNEVKKVTNSKVPLSNTIENVTGSDNISQMWKDHFKILFNSVQPDL